MAESVIRFKVETLDANAKIAHLTKKVQGLQVAVKNAGGTTRAAGDGFKVFAGGAQAAAVGARGLGAAVSAALGPVTAIAAAAASLGQVFGVLKQQDFAEAKVRSLGVNSEELTGRLKGVSRELSGQASVLDLTGAAYDVASAGFANAADAAGILKAASQGATGGFSDINTVADATTSVLNAYGMEANKAAQLVDGFIQTQNDGKIVIGQYAANIAKVAPVAAALGIPLEEVNAAVAQITAGGQGAEVTFTALKTALSAVAAGKVGKQFKALGVEINASTLKSDGLAGTLEKIKKSGADAGTVIKAFGTEAGPSILALLNDTEKYNKLLENQKKAQGAAAEAAFTASDTIDGQIKRLTTAFQNLFSDQSELGVIIKETFKVAAVTVEVLTVAFNNAVAPVRALFAFVHEVGKAIGSALGMDGVNAAFELEKGFQAVLTIVGKIGAFIIGLGRRIGQFVGGILAQVVQGAKNAATAIANVFGGIFGKVSEFITNAYKSLPGPLRALIESTVGAVTSGVQSIASFVTDTVDIGQGFTAGAGGQPANNIQSTQGLTGNAASGNAASGSADEERKKATELERQNAAYDKFVLNKKRERLLIEAQTPEQQKQLRLAMAKFDLNEKFSELTPKQLADARELLQLEFDAQQQREQRLATEKLIEEAKKKALDEEKQRAEKLKSIYQDIGSTIADGVVGALQGAVDGTKSLAEAATDMLRDLGNQLLRLGVNTALQGLFPGINLFSGLTGFANGGRPPVGRPSIVGERGPEIFVPSRAGTIIPNHAMGGANVTVNVDASGSSVQGNSPSASQLGKAIGAAVQAELIKQKRPGGLLTR